MASPDTSSTDTCLDGILNFEMAVSNLRSIKHLSYGEIEAQLQGFRAGLSMSRVMREVGLHDDPRLKILACLFDQGQYISAILDVIEEQFPIMREVIEDSIHDDSIIYIYPMPQGLNGYSFEEFWEATHSPQDCFFPAQSIEVFIKCLDQVIEEDGWGPCNDYFGWNMPEAPDYQTDCYLDIEKLEACLHCAGMDCFRAALDVAVGFGNVFFEYDPNDEFEGIEFTAENIVHLTEEWDIAKETLEELKQADAMLSENPALYRKFADLWNGALVKRDVSTRSTIEVRL